MLYPVAIDRGESSFGVRVPDIPGCFSGGDDYYKWMCESFNLVIQNSRLPPDNNRPFLNGVISWRQFTIINASYFSRHILY